MITLDDVLDFYLASSEDAGEDALAQMIRSYPQFANDLREFAALRKVNVLVPDPELTEDHQLRLSARAVSVVQNALFRKREESASGSPEALSSLRDEVDSKYRDANEFYQRTELSEGIIWTLDDRQVLFETIPRKAIENIADALGKLFDTVAAYLQGEMQLDPSFYKAEQTPEVVARISFVDLLKIDDDLTPEQKTFWLSQNPVTAGAAQENKGTNH